MITEAKKICTKCGKMKFVSHYYKAQDTKDSLRGECKECHKKWAHDRYHKIGDRKRKHARERYKIKKVEISQKRKDTWQFDRVRRRFKIALSSSRSWAKKKGYTPCFASEMEISTAFTGACEICGRTEDHLTRRLNLDHDHETGKFKGWLCTACNRAIGLFSESQSVLHSALTYVAKHNNA